MTYPRLSIEDFGEQLLRTGDLDPIYIALEEMHLPEARLSRWLLAYWCMYNAGSACWLSECISPAHFWDCMLEAAVNNTLAPTAERWPRGAERRHWRGQQAVESVHALRRLSVELGGPEAMVASLSGGARSTPHIPFREVRERVLQWRGFGPWIAFKVADMLERVAHVPISFEQSEVFMFDTPRKAAIMLAKQKMGVSHADARLKDEEWAIREVVIYLGNYFNGHLAPPTYDRVIGLQEIETILCKWKSHMSGHYPLLKDTTEITSGLGDWVTFSPTARAMREQMIKLEDAHV